MYLRFEPRAAGGKAQRNPLTLKVLLDGLRKKQVTSFNQGMVRKTVWIRKISIFVSVRSKLCRSDRAFNYHESCGQYEPSILSILDVYAQGPLFSRQSDFSFWPPTDVLS